MTQPNQPGATSFNPAAPGSAPSVPSGAPTMAQISAQATAPATQQTNAQINAPTIPHTPAPASTQPAPTATPGGAPLSLAFMPIDASAEPLQGQSSTVSAQEEAEFYRRSSATFQLEQNRQNLGVLGRFFGANSAASTNIAGAVVAIALIGVFATLFFPGNGEMVETRKLLIGLITSALSFIFGAASKGGK